MRLDRIEIENFKGISSRQSIEVRPITLLFGPNSAGKSTILQALHYLREILERSNVNPDVTIVGGHIDLGGFATLVHNHDVSRAVTLKVTLDCSDDQEVEGLPLNEGGAVGEREFAELPVRYLVGESPEYGDYAIVQAVGVEVDIRWSELGQMPYVARFAIELDGEPLAAIVSPPQTGRAQVTDFNFAHPLLLRALLLGDEPDDGSKEDKHASPLENEIRSLAREVAADRSTLDPQAGQLRITVGTKVGALPSLDEELNLDIRDPNVMKAEFEQRTARVNGLRSLLSELILGPARLVRDHLAQLTYIGPLREIPTRGYRPQVTPDEARWAYGLAAWDLLYNDRSVDLIEDVNRWLSSEDRLKTGYRLERVEYKELPVPSAMQVMFERGLTEDDVGELEELYHGLTARTEIGLREFEQGILVQPGDVGVGISQMIPVVVAALWKQDGILAIEQPELHVHPAIQVGMGDLFIQFADSAQDELPSRKTLIVETHSEHIMLRLLRRIRETTDNELPPGVTGLKPEDLSVVYVESIDEGVAFRSLHVDAEGEFLDRWPRGFFEERAGELF